MTLKEIKAMFVVGDKWKAVNTYVPKCCGERTVVEVKSAEIIWDIPSHGPRSYMFLPKKYEVLEASPGHLKFTLLGKNHTVTLDKI